MRAPCPPRLHLLLMIKWDNLFLQPFWDGDVVSCCLQAPLFSNSRLPWQNHCALFPTFSFGSGGWPMPFIPSWQSYRCAPHGCSKERNTGQQMCWFYLTGSSLWGGRAGQQIGPWRVLDPWCLVKHRLLFKTAACPVETWWIWWGKEKWNHGDRGYQSW